MSAKLDSEALAAHHNEYVTNFVYQPATSKWQDRGEWRLSLAVDARILNIETFWDLNHPKATPFPAIEGISREEARQIAFDAHEMNRRLRSAIEHPHKTPTQEEVLKAFGDLHRILTPTTDGNHYVRTLIEKSLKAMDIDIEPLGELSTRQFAEIERSWKTPETSRA